MPRSFAASRGLFQNGEMTMRGIDQTRGAAPRLLHEGVADTLV